MLRISRDENIVKLWRSNCIIRFIHKLTLCVILEGVFDSTVTSVIRLNACWALNPGRRNYFPVCVADVEVDGPLSEMFRCRISTTTRGVRMPSLMTSYITTMTSSPNRVQTSTVAHRKTQQWRHIPCQIYNHDTMKTMKPSRHHPGWTRYSFPHRG